MRANGGAQTCSGVDSSNSSTRMEYTNGESHFAEPIAHDDSAPASFSLRCDSLKLMLMAVSSVYNSKRDQYGVVKVNPLGMSVSVETAAKSMQAEVMMKYDRYVVLIVLVASLKSMHLRRAAS